MLIKHLILKPEFFSHWLYSLQFRKRSNGFWGFFSPKDTEKLLSQTKRLLFFQPSLESIEEENTNIFIHGFCG